MSRPGAVPDPPSGEPTPWATGVAVAIFVAALTAAGIYSFGAALAQVHWTLAVAVNVIAVAGTTPTVWRWRRTPVARWILSGVGAGVLIGWLILLIAAVAQ
ncbi:DUF2537 domain-containing protein [Nocardia sp. NPDC052254]|uniref:DUF2537 domain-containing protein n=1 Tax=Nocardia sp. NPDC052254 TaxID=3155681 RepID=UPI00343CDEBD